MAKLDSSVRRRSALEMFMESIRPRMGAPEEQTLEARCPAFLPILAWILALGLPLLFFERPVRDSFLTPGSSIQDEWHIEVRQNVRVSVINRKQAELATQASYDTLTVIRSSQAHAMTKRPIYSVRQCREIYNRIKLAQQHRHAPGDQSRMVATGQGGLAFLTALQQAFLLHVPFENLELHYSEHKTISVDPEVIFSKIVAQQSGRDGYCSENNNLFAILLRSLGFHLYMISARVSYASAPGGSQHNTGFTGLGHQATIVTINGQKYLVDVGFGNGGPTRPMPLLHEAESLRLPPSQRARMVYTSLPDAEMESAANVWLYERTLHGKAELGWVPGYCFPDVECTHQDFELTNLFFSSSGKSWFTYSIVCSKFIAEGDEIVGYKTVYGDKCKVESRGKSETECRFASEEERVDGLENLLGVKLSDTQRKAIRGTATAL